MNVVIFYAVGAIICAACITVGIWIGKDLGFNEGYEARKKWEIDKKKMKQAFAENFDIYIG